MSVPAIGKFSAFGFVTGILMAVPAQADDIPPCQAPQGVSVAALPGGLPPVLKKDLADRFGQIVLPNEKFDSTDIRITGHSRRFIFAWSIGAVWIVATEHGGVGYNDPIFRYEVGTETATLVQTLISFPNAVCAAATGLVPK